MKTMGAALAKTHFLSLLDEVRDKRTTVTITKNGKPVARMVPIINKDEPDPIFGFMRDKGRIVGDITKPIYTDEEYEEFYRRKDAMYAPIRTVVTK
jgi:prevent-host-death family protein